MTSKGTLKILTNQNHAEGSDFYITRRIRGLRRKSLITDDSRVGKQNLSQDKPEKIVPLSEQVPLSNVQKKWLSRGLWLGDALKRLSVRPEKL